MRRISLWFEKVFFPAFGWVHFWLYQISSLTFATENHHNLLQQDPKLVLVRFSRSISQYCHTYCYKLLHGFLKLKNHQNPLQQNPIVPVRFSNSKCVRGSDYKHLLIFVHIASLLFGLLGHSDYKSEFCISIRAKLSWKDHFEVLGEMQYISANSERN